MLASRTRAHLRKLRQQRNLSGLSQEDKKQSINAVRNFVIFGGKQGKKDHGVRFEVFAKRFPLAKDKAGVPTPTKRALHHLLSHISYVKGVLKRPCAEQAGEETEGAGMNNISIWAARQPWERRVDFAILDNPIAINGGESILGARAVVKSLTFEQMQACELIMPTFTMSDTAAQQLFNDLWNLGFRPADGTGNSGHIEALKYHLEDMRKIVFSGSKS